MHVPVRLVRPSIFKSAVLVFALTMAMAVPALATPNVTSSRVAGANREATAVEIATQTFPSAEDVVIARSDKFPDALAGTYLANAVNGPLLLTRSNRLSPETAAGLVALGAQRVYILGGTAAVSASVQAELAQDYDVTRVGGDDRFETASAIARFGDPLDIGTLGTSGRTAIVTRADGFADALAGGPVSFAGSFPLLLTRTASLSAEARDALTDLDIEYVLIFGGAAAVSLDVENAIEDMGITVQRIGGGDRMETAAMIGDFARDQLSFTLQSAELARGDIFPDALAGGVRAGVLKMPIVLTRNPETLGSPTAAWLRSHNDTIRAIEAFGGTRAITDDTLQDAVDAATTP